MRIALFTLWAVAVFAATPERTLPRDISLVRIPNGGIQPQAVLDRTGTLHLLYYAGNPTHGDLFYVKSSDAGRTWSPPLRVNSQAGTAIAAGTIRGGQIALGRNGRVHVAESVRTGGMERARPQWIVASSLSGCIRRQQRVSAARALS